MRKRIGLIEQFGGLGRRRCIKIMDNNKNYRQFISLFTNEGTVVCRAIPEWSFRAERRRCSGQDDKERLSEQQLVLWLLYKVVNHYLKGKFIRYQNMGSNFGIFADFCLGGINLG